MNISAFVDGIKNFDELSHVEKIKIFAWYLHERDKVEHFTPSDIKTCYQAVHMEQPANIGGQLLALNRKNPREVLKGEKGYSLEKRVRAKIKSNYGERDTTVQIDVLLSTLPMRIPTATEKVYLEEALICFRHKAYRASIVMCWNLAYDHVCDYIYQKELNTFNTKIPIRYPAKKSLVIVNKEDFTNLKESEVIEVAKSAGIISSNVFKIMDEKLKKRNMAAHPSNLVIDKLQAEECIHDLVENVVLKIVV
jgi:hypothetical protein